MYISDNNNFATWQHGQENDPVFIFSLGSLAPRSLALEVFKSRILLLLQLPQLAYIFELSLLQGVSQRGHKGTAFIQHSSIREVPVQFHSSYAISSPRV